jgi:ketosteroid isomerase-like protein
MATREQIVEANRATLAAWNAHDPDAVAALFAEDAVIRDVGSSDTVRGRPAIRARAADLLAAFPDFALRQLDLVVGEDANADRWEATGTHRGRFLGMRRPAAGSRWRAPRSAASTPTGWSSRT